MAVSLSPPAPGRTVWNPARADAHVVNVLTFDLLLVVALQKFAIPLAGREAQIGSAFLIHAAVLGYFALCGLVRLSRPRLVLFLAIVSVVALTQYRLPPGGVSLPSMILMLATSALLVVVIPLDRTAYHRLLGRFVAVACLAGTLVFLDWGTQALGLGMPDLEQFIPSEFVYFEYNYVQPLEWGSPWMKPNGVFFLETSHVSQFVGIGFVVELALFRRFKVALFLGCALLATLGVTGMILVASSLPFFLLRLRPTAALAALVALPILLATLFQAGLLDGFVRRSSEFSQSSSSGYNRFVLPLEWSADTLTGDAEKAWFGTGAGSMPKAINDEEKGTAGLTWPPYTKVGVEYGGIVLGLWLSFIVISLFGSVPFLVSWVAFVQYAFMNGSLNVPIHTVYCCLLCSGYALSRASHDRSLHVPSQSGRL